MSEPDRAPLRRGDPSRGGRILAPDLDGLVTYDDRLIRAATEAGLITISPGTEAA